MLLNLLKNNFGLKVLAVCLAVTAWAYFHLAAAPGTTAKFDQTLAVPIVVTGLRTGYQARYADKVATVVIEVPRNGTAVKPDQVQAVLDVSDLVDPGFHNVPVKIVSPDVAIRSLSPASVTLSLDRLEERVVPVSVDYVGDRRSIALSYDRFHDFERTIQLNYLGTIKLVMGLLPAMRERRAGHIINISSIAGKNALPNGAAYAASKWGLNGLSYSVAEELRGHNIRVSVICPGSTNTDLSPHAGKDTSKMLQPDDVAHAVAMLVTQTPQSFVSEIILRPTQKP